MTEWNNILKKPHKTNSKQLLVPSTTTALHHRIKSLHVVCNSKWDEQMRLKAQYTVRICRHQQMNFFLTKQGMSYEVLDAARDVKTSQITTMMHRVLALWTQEVLYYTLLVRCARCNTLVSTPRFFASPFVVTAFAAPSPVCEGAPKYMRERWQQHNMLLVSTNSIQQSLAFLVSSTHSLWQESAALARQLLPWSTSIAARKRLRKNHTLRASTG